MNPRDRLAGVVPDENITVVEQALLSLDFQESPPGSNRGPEIDALADEFGEPHGSAWCAMFAARAWKKAGLDVAPEPASCESWRRWSLQTCRFSSHPIEGAVVLYGAQGKEPAEHCGIVVRVSPILEDAEGNTSFGDFSREGVAAALKPVNAPRLIGYVWPRPITTEF